ncbi:hypothetical protein [Streptomyces sp. NPDC087300]|uniref:hypothetical protein n=1 Tax=Streptomyces sp. NPDC087300 TaxID=3365780 RepID=UPI0037F1D02E
MEATELAERAVGALTAVVTGAAGGVGQEVGAAVSELVRARLGGTERGRGALAGLDSDAESATARSEAQAVLREEIEADQELRRELTSRLDVSTTYTRDAVVITGSRLSRSQISLGPLTVHNTPGGWTFLSIAALVLAALIALGVYGGVRVITDEGSPDARPQRSEGERAEPTGARKDDARSNGSTGGNATLTPEEVDAAVPTRESLRSGWTVYDDEDHVAAEDRETGCHPDGAWFENDPPKDLPGDRGYLNAWFRLYACPSQARAAALFDEQVAADGGRKTPHPRLGDESVLLASETGKGTTRQMSATTLVRVGTVIIKLDYNPFGSLPAHEEQIVRLSRLATERVERALGERP